MGFLFTLFAPPLGLIMRLCYSIAGDIGFAIVLFTIIVRIIMFPLSIKQHKTTAKSQIFAPQMREIQMKYRNNQQKFQEEYAKLQKKGYNPSGGCLPMIITMLVLFGVLGVVYKPMTYFEKIDSDEIKIVNAIALEIESRVVIEENAEEIEEKFAAEFALDKYKDDIENEYQNLIEDFKDIIDIDDAQKANLKTKAEENIKKQIRSDIENGYTKSIESTYKNLQSEMRAIGVYRDNPKAFTELSEAAKDRIKALDLPNKKDKLSEETIKKLDSLKDRIVFLGVDFSKNPDFTFPLIIIPILSFIFAAIHMVITQLIQRRTSPESVAQMGAMKYMIYLMPIMSLVFPFNFPAGAGFYWAISSAVMVLQTLLLNKLFPPQVLRADALAAMEKQGKGVDKVVVIEKHDGQKLTKKSSEMSKSEQKEYYRKKLEEARKSDLEKYGEIGKSSGNSDDSDK